MFQYKANCIMIRVFRAHPTIYYNLYIKSSEAAKTVASLANEPTKESINVAKAICPVDFI